MFCNLIKVRATTFIYSDRQTEIAGKDGEKEFNEVFGSQARLVVVLFREKWGQTSWTQIEETAIRNRAFNETYDFALFIPLFTSFIPDSQARFWDQEKASIGLTAGAWSQSKPSCHLDKENTNLFFKL